MLKSPQNRWPLSEAHLGCADRADGPQTDLMFCCKTLRPFEGLRGRTRETAEEPAFLNDFYYFYPTV